jgi:hypothetical protein
MVVANGKKETSRLGVKICFALLDASRISWCDIVGEMQNASGVTPPRFQFLEYHGGILGASCEGTSFLSDICISIP